MFSKTGQWLLTEKGRTCTMYGVTAVAVGLTSLTYVPNTLLLDKYKEVVQLYRSGKEVPLNQELQNKYNKCLEILKVPENYKKILVPFSIFGFDLFNAGSCNSKFGALIGIPTNFNYKTKDDIDRDAVMVNQKNVNWDSEAGKKLEDAIVLPENLQLFGICREILSTQNHKIFLDSAYPMVCMSIIYTIGQLINQKILLKTTPRPIRGVFYTMLSVFGLGIYFFLKDFTEVTYETIVDKKLCELGPEFIESGVQFYDKLLKRNQALRELLGDEGEKKYSKLGNENFFLRQPRINIVHRKMFFEYKLKENEENKLD